MHAMLGDDSSDLYRLRPWFKASPGPQLVHIIQRKVVLRQMKPEGTRLGKVKAPVIPNSEPSLFYRFQPPAGLGRVVGQGSIQIIQGDACVVKAPV